MGKRRMHGRTVAQCDWSGMLLKGPVAKTRHGMYRNWESALAHAETRCSLGTLTEAELLEAREHVTVQAGVLPQSAPHYEQLAWFGGSLGGAQYVALCEHETGELDAVQLAPGGEEQDVTLDSEGGRFMVGCELGVLHTKAKFEIVAFCGEDPEGEANTACEKYPQLAPVHGNVYLLKRSLLEPWRSTPRYLRLTKAEWHLLHHPPRYRRAELQSEMAEYEALISKDAVAPLSLLKGMKMPAKSGRALADYAKLHLGPVPRARARGLEGSRECPSPKAGPGTSRAVV